MKKHSFLIKQLVSFFILITLSLLIPKQALAQTSPWRGVCVSQRDPGVVTIQGFQCLIANILLIALPTIGLAGFVMMIVGSFRWLVSGGNTQATEKARNTMMFAVVGLVVALSAFIILNLVSKFTGIDSILEFSIPDSTKNW